MNIFVAFIAFFAHLSLQTRLSTSPLSSITQQQSLSSVPEPGRGYASDTQQLSQAICYKMVVNSKSDPKSNVQLESGQSFQNFTKTFGIDVMTKGGYGMFGVGPSFTFMRSISDTGSSFSINYYHLIERQVLLKFNTSGVLNDVGKMIYQDGKNAIFRLACGDQIITSYKQRVSLVFSFSLQLHTQTDKQTIMEGLGKTYGSFFNISDQIQALAIQNTIQGTISLQVFQIGGDPNKIGQIIKTKDPSGSFYMLKCNIQKQTVIKSVISMLLEYSYRFPDQVIFQKQQDFDTVANNIIKYTSADYFGITLAPSFVTNDINMYRQNLSSSLLQSQYYIDKLNQLLQNYPGTWLTTSNIYKFLQHQHQTASNNIKSLFNPINPEQGAKGCYSNPDRCADIYQQLQLKLSPFNTTGMKAYLEEYLQYKYLTFTTMFLYRNGDTGHDWVTKIYGNMTIKNTTAFINVTNYQISYIYYDQTKMANVHFFTDGAGLISNNKGVSYHGKTCTNTTKGKNCTNSTIRPQRNSQYYFLLYNQTLIKGDIYEGSQIYEEKILSIE